MVHHALLVADNLVSIEAQYPHPCDCHQNSGFSVERELFQEQTVLLPTYTLAKTEERREGSASNQALCLPPGKKCEFVQDSDSLITSRKFYVTERDDRRHPSSVGPLSTDCVTRSESLKGRRDHACSHQKQDGSTCTLQQSVVHAQTQCPDTQWPSLEESRVGLQTPICKIAGSMGSCCSNTLKTMETSKQVSEVSSKNSPSRGQQVDGWEVGSWLRAAGKSEQITRNFGELQKWPSLVETKKKRRDNGKCIVIKDDVQDEVRVKEFGKSLALDCANGLNLDPEYSISCEREKRSDKNDHNVNDHVQKDQRNDRETYELQPLHFKLRAISSLSAQKRIRPLLWDFCSGPALPTILKPAGPTLRDSTQPCNVVNTVSTNVNRRGTRAKELVSGAQPILVMLNTDFIVTSPVKENLLLLIALTQKRGSQAVEGADLQLAKKHNDKGKTHQVLVGQFTAFSSFVGFGLGRDALRVKYEQNAGGSSTISEVKSF